MGIKQNIVAKSSRLQPNRLDFATMTSAYNYLPILYFQLNFEGVLVYTGPHTEFFNCFEFDEPSGQSD